MSALATVTSTGLVGWRPHPEAWVMVLGLVAIGWYTTRVIQPKAVALGHQPVTRRQKLWYVAAVLGLWLASDWPVHDVAEEQLYVVHKAQHMLLSLILPAMFLLATPRWLVHLVAPPGSRLWGWLRTGTKPLVAGLVFNALTVSLHYAGLVQLSLDYGPVHFGLHMAVFVAGLMMWTPVCGPVEEWRLSPPAQIFYLFLMSMLPTVPGGWLMFAERVVYEAYDTPERLWGIDALVDQQMAGALMKLGGGFLFGKVIIVVFFSWAASEQRQQEAARRRPRPLPDLPDPTAPALTYEAVTRAFGEAGPPPRVD